MESSVTPWTKYAISSRLSAHPSRLLAITSTMRMTRILFNNRTRQMRQATLSPELTPRPSPTLQPTCRVPLVRTGAGRRRASDMWDSGRVM
jgi:hypothetical protein